MVSEGPTTTGSINAKIGAVITELQGKVAEAKALVKDLTGEKTNVKVGADVGEAVTKLSAVEAAQRKLGVATESLKLAYQRLDDVQTAGGASQSRLMALHLAATRAENAHADAVRALARAVQDEGDDEEESSKKVKAAQNGRAGYWQIIAAAVAALIPLLAPLASYAAGVAGALGAMGVTGVLAVLGIKNAMQQGTAAGNDFSSGLQILKGDLNELSNTAAVTILSSFYLAISQINAAMPQLNSETRLFSQQLGNTGNFLLGGLVTGLRVAEPLLLQAGVYIEQVAAGFMSWTQNGGLAAFVQYAVSQLPRVAATLGELAQLILHVVEAAAPLGTVVLGALQGVAFALNAIPIQVLTALIAGGGAFFLAYRAWAALTPIIQSVAVAIGSVGAAEDLALGPIGLVIAAVTALGAAVGATAVSMQSGAQAQEDYTAAVQQDNGVIGENVKLQAAKNLQDEGAYANAKKLGIQTDILVQAALGNASATKQVTEAQSKASKSYDDLIAKGRAYVDSHREQVQGALQQKVASEELSSSTTTEAGSVKAAIRAYNDLQNALGGATISTKEQLQAEMDNARQYGASVSAYEAAKASQKQTADQLKATTLQMQLQGDAAGLLKQALDILDGKTLDVAEAQTGLAAANNSLTDSFKQYGVVVEGNSKQAVANQQAIQQSIEAAHRYAEAIGTQTHSSAAATQALQSARQQMEDNLASQGLLTDSVKGYIEQIFQIPTRLPPTKPEFDDADARKQVAAWEAFIKQAIPTNIRLGVHLDTSNNATGGTIGGYATGGTIGAFADGGSWGTVPNVGSTTSDSFLTRLSAHEEVTKASAASYPGVRPLLKQINADPGGVMKALAAPQAATKTTTIHNWYVTNAVDPGAVAAEVQRRQNMRVA